MSVFAAVDIGSNSVRLKIAQLDRGRLKVLHEDREVTRLGESVFRSGILSPQAIEHTVKVLRRFHKATQQYRADLVRAVATSAIRDANNSAVFTDWVRRSTGWNIDVISGLEEGRLIHLGVMANAKLQANRMLLIDLGGGSCELTVTHRGEIEEMFSLPLGAVRLTRDFLQHDPPLESELDQLRAFIEEEISRVEEKLTQHRVDLTIATSGTPAALSDAWSFIQKHAPGTAPIVSANGLVQLTQRLSRLDLEGRKKVKGVGPKRAEIIVAGAWVFTLLLSRLRLPSFRYVQWGLRDGLLQQMAGEHAGSGSELRKRVVADREKSLIAVAQHYQVDVAFAKRVRGLSEKLFMDLRRVHDLPVGYLDLLQAAAMLQEVGSFVSRIGRRRHAYYLVRHSELLGYTPREQKIIAALVRYLGKSRPTPQSAAVRSLAPADRAVLPKAIMILRMARALDQSRRGAVKKFDVNISPSKVTLTFRSKGTELELWALEKEKAYFKSVFGRGLVCRSE